MPIALAFFVQYAYVILFLWVLGEQLGVPIPSIPLLLTAGTLSATHRIHATYALAAVLLACILADSLWYALGRRYGNSVLKLLCRLSLEASTCVSKTESYFNRRGPVTLLFAKFVPGLSTVAAPIAGQTGMPYGRFLLWDLAGSILWSETYLLAGRFFGDLAQRSARFFHYLSHFALIIFVLLVLVFIAYRVWKNRRFLIDLRASRIEPEDLAQMLTTAAEQGNIPPFIVDLRHPLDYLPDPRVLPGALRISPKEIAAHAADLPHDRDVILYCTCPSEETSAKVAQQLLKLGVHRVRPLRGGFEVWRDSGYPLEDYADPAAVSEPVNLRATA
jgi:membrane protein DedA with SNARE-associated domain/rhodanese-related sulfurtransferase